MKTTEESLLEDLNAIIARAAAAGLVATISIDHQQPLAMGNYKMVAAIRPARHAPAPARAAWPDPAKMHFDPDSPDKYNASLRVDDGKQRRRRND